MPTSTTELQRIVEAAKIAAPAAAAATPEQRIGWLDAMATALDDAAPELVSIATTETHLDAARLTGEVARTTAQLRLFCDMIQDGAYLEATIDHADPSTTPPRPDLRRLLIPIGPVAVFAASNFPFAFSVAGGDTASALAVGCPVIVKVHEGHPATSLQTAAVLKSALTAAGAPPGLLDIVNGRGAGVELVQNSAIRAAAFTGSLVGGRRLFDLAAGRPDPIPFYGELGSINPVVLTPNAIARRGEALATGLARSFTLGAGQYCTKPGVVFVPEASGFERLVLDALPDTTPATLLTPKIGADFARGAKAAYGDPDLDVLMGDPTQEASSATSLVLGTSADALVARGEQLLVERFGPATLLVRYRDDRQLRRALTQIAGSLTATLHSEPDDDVTGLIQILTERSGRLLFDGWPTGVTVSWSQHHGGPWPATTSIHTSVGTSAARRFLRPMVFQDAPEVHLPLALRESNPLRVPRRVDGTLQLQD